MANYLTERQRFVIPVVVFPIAFALGTAGFWHYNAEVGIRGLLNAGYHALQLFILHVPHFEKPVPLALEFGRWLALITTAMAIIDFAMHFLHSEKVEWELTRKKNHVIVCGLGARGMDMVLKLNRNGLAVVAIEKNPQQEVVERLEMAGVPLVRGDASHPEILKKARIEYAAEMYTFCSDDTTNLYIATAASAIPSLNPSPRKCTIFISDTELRNVLQGNQLQQTGNETQMLYFYEPFGPEATNLIIDALPLDHEGIGPDDPCSVHLVIMGFGIMGRTIATKAAQLGRFANRKKLRISVIDRYAEMHKQYLLFHHPYISDVAEFRFYQQEVLSPDTRSLLSAASGEPHVLLNVVICFDNPAAVFDVVFNLLPVLNKPGIRVGVRLHESESFSFMLRGAIDTYKNLNLCVFGMDSQIGEFLRISASETEAFARAVHQAHFRLQHQLAAGHPSADGIVASAVHEMPWEQLPEDFRESSRQQTLHMKFKIRAAGLEIADKTDPREAVSQIGEPMRTALAIMEHDRWIAERKVNNWIYGKHADKPHRISEYLIDWQELPEDIRKYDFDSVDHIPFYLDIIGKKLVRNLPPGD